MNHASGRSRTNAGPGSATSTIPSSGCIRVRCVTDPRPELTAATSAPITSRTTHREDSLGTPPRFHTPLGERSARRSVGQCAGRACCRRRSSTSSGTPQTASSRLRECGPEERRPARPPWPGTSSPPGPRPRTRTPRRFPVAEPGSPPSAQPRNAPSSRPGWTRSRILPSRRHRASNARCRGTSYDEYRARRTTRSPLDRQPSPA